MATQQTLPQVKAEPSSSGDWRTDQKSGYVAHFNLETLQFEGPEDAFVWLGLPYEGDPRRTTRFDEHSKKEVPCAPWLDETQISIEIGGVPVKWIEWDQPTMCNVYKRGGK